MFEKIMAFLKGRFIINLYSEEREGGYMYVYSPDLKGFSLLLEPDQTKDILSMLSAMQEPMLAYAEAYEDGRREAKARAKETAKATAKESRYQVIDFGQTSHSTFRALIGGTFNHC